MPLTAAEIEFLRALARAAFAQHERECARVSQALEVETNHETPPEPRTTARVLPLFRESEKRA